MDLDGLPQLMVTIGQVRSVDGVLRSIVTGLAQDRSVVLAPPSGEQSFVTVTVGSAYSFQPSASDANGDTLAFMRQNAQTSRDIYVLSLRGEPRPLRSGAGRQETPKGEGGGDGRAAAERQHHPQRRQVDVEAQRDQGRDTEGEAEVEK